MSTPDNIPMEIAIPLMLVLWGVLTLIYVKEWYSRKKAKKEEKE